MRWDEGRVSLKGIPPAGGGFAGAGLSDGCAFLATRRATMTCR